MPWDVEQKLRGQWTHRVAEAMCRLSVRLDLREASEELKGRSEPHDAPSKRA